MVATRSRRFDAASTGPNIELGKPMPHHVIGEPFELKKSHVKTDTSSYSHQDGGDDELETIGSRLRKRRRTGSSPIDKKRPSPRRSVLKKSTVPPLRRQSTASENNTPSKAVSSLSSPNSSAQHHSVAQGLVQNSIPQTVGHDLQNGQGIHDSMAGGMTPQSSVVLPSEILSQPPNLATIIANIIEHAEAIERRYREMGPVDTEGFTFLNASHHLKLQSLPILDNLATQVLTTLAKSSYEEILTMITDPKSPSGEAYGTLKSLFDHTKRVYSIQDHFLCPYELDLVEPAYVDTLRKANMATYVSSVFGSQEVGFYYLNEYFLDTFVVDGKGLRKSEAQLFLDLKTQAFISAVSNGSYPREKLLEDLFPGNLEERLLLRKPSARQLSPSESDFVQRAQNRSKALLEESGSEEAISLLPHKYVWEIFLRDISVYVGKHFKTIVGNPAPKPIRRGRATNALVTPPQSKVSEDLDKPDEKIVKDHGGTPTESIEVPPPQIMMDLNTIAEKAARAAQSAIQGFDMNQAAAAPHFQIQHQPEQMQLPQSQPPQFPYHFAHQPPPTDYYHGSPYQHAPAPPAQMDHHSPDLTNQYDIHGDQNTIPGQAVPTHALYERARMAETSKASPSTRRAGHPSQRRPWSTQEEAALLDGLDRVKGPHWSQILAMYGAGGSVSEALKDRNQVQLKDKARNFKLYFLKNNIQLPYSLSLVTGELRTRAPAQAAKNEAEERERLSEDYGYTEAGMTQALGLAEDNGNTADGTSENGGNTNEFDGHNDENVINADQADSLMENAEDTSIKELYDDQQQRSENTDDMPNDSNQNNQNEDIKAPLTETSEATLQTPTKQIRKVET